MRCFPKEIEIIVFQYVDPWFYITSCPVKFQGLVSYFVEDPTRIIEAPLRPFAFPEKRLESLARQIRIKVCEHEKKEILSIPTVASILLEAMRQVESE